MKRLIATGISVVTLSMGMLGGLVTFAAPASATATCGGDHGAFDRAHYSDYVGGTWHNCGSTWDWVKIVVNNAADSPCTGVGPRSQVHITYDPSWWSNFGSHERSWVRC